MLERKRLYSMIAPITTHMPPHAASNVIITEMEITVEEVWVVATAPGDEVGTAKGKGFVEGTTVSFAAKGIGCCTGVGSDEGLGFRLLSESRDDDDVGLLLEPGVVTLGLQLGPIECNEGITDGMHVIGLCVSIIDGWNVVKDWRVDGSVDGISEGFRKGCFEGLCEGFIEGWYEEWNDGFFDGLSVDNTDGVVVGGIEGIEVGEYKGESVGIADGSLEGKVVVGKRDGIQEGRSVGSVVGNKVGWIEIVGDIEGWDVGSFVGGWEVGWFDGGQNVHAAPGTHAFGHISPL